MIVSHQKKFLYIDIPKTGSTSVERLLADLCELRPWQKKNFWHRSVRDLEPIFHDKGWLWDDYYKFTVVRNPVERLFSYHKYRLKFSEEAVEGYSPRMQRFIQNCFQYRSACEGDFVDAHKSFDKAIEKGLLDVPSQASFVCNDADELAIDHCLKLEVINSDIQILFEKLEIPISSQKSLPCLNQAATSYDGDPAQLLSNKSFNTIQCKYELDFTLFDYK